MGGRWSWAWGFTCRAGWRTLFSRTLSQQASQVICWQRNFLIIHQAKISFSISDDVIFARNWKNLQAHVKGVSGTCHLPLAPSDVHVKYVATICCACACVAADDDECCTHALHWFAWQSEGMDGLTTGQRNFFHFLLKSFQEKGSSNSMKCGRMLRILSRHCIFKIYNIKLHRALLEQFNVVYWTYSYVFK